MQKQFSSVVAISIFLSSCGLWTPDLQESWGTSEDANTKIKLIVQQVKCEIRKAARLVEIDDIYDYKAYGQPRTMQWLEGWGVDANFIFTIEEKTSFNPGVSFNTPMQNAITSFPGAALPGTAPLTATSSALTKLTATTPQLYSFGIGGGLSSDAYRQDKLHILYNLSDLIGPEKDLPSRDIAEQSCRPTESANASIIIDSDLKLDEWLQNIASIEGRKQGKIELPNSFATSGVLSHEIRFEVVTSGNITPVWHLVRVSANTGTGNLFNTSRDRTQDLILTFGPIKNGELHSNARAAANTGDLGATIGNVIRILP